MKRTLLTTAILIGVSGLAMASNTATDGFVVESGVHPHDDQKNTTHQVWIQQMSDGDHVYELRMEDGIYTVTVDGDPIPDERIQNHDDVVMIMEDDGGVFYEFDLSLTAGRPPALPKTKNLFFAPSGQTGAFLNVVAGEDDGNITLDVQVHPKVMLGIYSDEPSESLREHLGIKGRAILVESVIDGLSADQAGIKDHDIIVSIDGSDGISPDGLTKLLREHEAGDEIKIVILRKGQKMKVQTKLLAYDAQALGHDPIIRRGRGALPGDQNSKFPGWTADSKDNSSWRFFSPETQELTSSKILDVLRETGMDEKKIAEIEEQIRASLEENVWSAFGHDGHGTVVEMHTDGHVNPQGIKGQVIQRQYLIESAQRKAEQAMLDAERMTLEFKNGELLLKRHAENLKGKIHGLNTQLHESVPVIEEELQGRLGELEERLDELETVLDSRMESLTGLIERLIDRLDED